MARESRLILEVVVGPRTQESATKLVEGASERLAPNCWPLWSSVGLKIGIPNILKSLLAR